MTKIVVPLARGFEEIESVTIIDVLRRADLKVICAGLGEITVKGAHGIKIEADQRLKNINHRVFAGLVLPGGMPGTENLRREKRVLNLIQEFAAQEKLVGAICAAPLVLKAAGVLENISFTSYPGFAQEFTGYDYQDDKPVVEDDNIITSRGPGTALPFALQIVKYFQGQEVSQELASNMLVD